MTSVRKDLRLSDSVVSVRQRASDTHLLSEPISVRKLANEMSPGVVTRASPGLSAGDVSGSALVTLSSNGGYSFTGHVDTSKYYFGDQFTVTAVINHADASGKGDAFKYEGEFETGLFDKKSDDWNITGDDIWIENNWPAVKNASITFKLLVTWNVTAKDILLLGFYAGLVTVAVLVGGSSKDGCWQKDEAGNMTYRIPCGG